MPNAADALKAKMGTTAPAPAPVAPTMDPLEIANTKVGYPGEEEVDQLALSVHLNKVALQMMAKEIQMLKAAMAKLIKMKSK